jgi:hypothetical protein
VKHPPEEFFSDTLKHAPDTLAHVYHLPDNNEADSTQGTLKSQACFPKKRAA